MKRERERKRRHLALHVLDALDGHPLGALVAFAVLEVRFFLFADVGAGEGAEGGGGREGAAGGCGYACERG